MDKQEFFQSYMDHWGITDVLLDCYVDLLTMNIIEDKNKKLNQINIFKQLLTEHNIKCKEQQIFEDEIRQLKDDIQKIKNK